MKREDMVAQVLRTCPEGTNVVRICPDGSDIPDEVVFELTNEESSPDYGNALAIIWKSAPHYHKKTRERYTVKSGKICLYYENTSILLREGDMYIITPGKTHWVWRGNGSVVEVESWPHWAPNDHFKENI